MINRHQGNSKWFLRPWIKESCVLRLGCCTLFDRFRCWGLGPQSDDSEDICGVGCGSWRDGSMINSTYSFTKKQSSVPSTHSGSSQCLQLQLQGT